MTDKAYTTEAKVNTFLNTTVTAGVLDDIILAVQKFIEEYTGRNFKADSEASARLYDGNDSQELVIDDCIEVSTVEVGNNNYGDTFTTIGTSGTDRYYTLPNNNDVDGVPIRKLHLRSRTFLSGFQNHRITAKWGYSENVPDDVSHVATVLVSSIYKFGRSGAVGGVKTRKIDKYTITFGNDNDLAEFNRALEILDNYKKFEL